MTKRANGSGSVERLPAGRWRVRVSVGGKRLTLGVFADEKTARSTLAAWNIERAEGTVVAGHELTLGSYGEGWLDLREVRGSRKREEVRSIASERSVWRRQVMPSAIASMTLTEIRPRDLDAFALELRARKAMHAITVGRGSARAVKLRETSRPLSRAQQREAIRLVRMVLDDAVRADLIERSPAIGASVAVGTTKPRDLSEDWLRWPEIVQLLGCEKIDARDRRAFACAIGLALRANDLRAIEVSRVELDCEVPGPGIAVLVSKSERWHRVPIMPWLAPIVRAQLASLPAGARYLFPRPDGKRYAAGYDFGWAAHVERGEGRTPVRPGALERAGVARRVRFHDLRGTCATHLALGTWGRRWSLHEIQAMLAHSDQRVTERYVRRAIDTLSDAARDTPGCPALPLAVGDGIAKSPSNYVAPGPGLEPGTNRLTAPPSAEEDRALAGDLGQRLGNLAHDVLALAADGSPHTVARALELADAALALLAATTTRPGSARAGGER